MTGFQWAHANAGPKGISIDDFVARLQTLPEPSPDASFEASKNKDDLLHEATFGEGDQVWANKARRDAHRKWIGAVREEVFIGGKAIIIRAVECLHVNDEDRWATLDNIRSDPELMAAYFHEAILLLEQAQGKLLKCQQLMDQAKEQAE